MRWLNNVKTAVLLGALVALCMAIGYLVGGPYGMGIGLAFGAVSNLLAYYFSDKIALLTMGGRELGRDELPWLHEIVERLAARAGLPAPRIYVCPQPAPNAFATGRNPQNAVVALTDGMLRNLPAREIEGVVAHELSHIKHRDILISSVAAVLAGAISYAGYMLMFFGGGRNSRDNPLAGVGGLVMIILAPLAAGLIQMAISRQREYAADSYGGELCGDPLELAGALARLEAGNERIPTETHPAFHNMYIVEPFTGGGVMSLFSTHPPIERRIAALREQAANLR